MINIKKLEEYNLKVYPSFQLNNVLIYSFNSNFQVKHAISAAKFTELESKSYIREYLSSSDRRKTFERRNGLSLGTLSRWMKMYEIEDPKMQKSIIDPQLIDEDSASLIAQPLCDKVSITWHLSFFARGYDRSALSDQLAPRRLHEALHKSNRQLQRDLDTTKMLHEACEVLIDLTEQTYHIPVRKNSDAK